MQRLQIERQQSSGVEGWVGSLSYPSCFKKSFQRLCICSCVGRMFAAGCSSSLVQPGQGCGRCFGKVNVERLAQPIPTLSLSKSCTISWAASAERHPQEIAVCQSLSYVLPILLWVTQIKSSEGTVPAQCASPETLICLGLGFFCHNKE